MWSPWLLVSSVSCPPPWLSPPLRLQSLLYCSVSPQWGISIFTRKSQLIQFVENWGNLTSGILRGIYYHWSLLVPNILLLTVWKKRKNQAKQRRHSVWTSLEVRYEEGFFAFLCILFSGQWSKFNPSVIFPPPSPGNPHGIVPAEDYRWKKEMESFLMTEILVIVSSLLDMHCKALHILKWLKFNNFSLLCLKIIDSLGGWYY